ncbi:type II toxin-antitoxin system PemK/MazF family toxin [Sulfurospirillum sp. T05]|uniref:Type II toxin-antitoxin system PemK/MazF family toxin n=1 Tax=Sulfurospirillum tamanense TaxID=2813362 RepID=A0ABS2WPL9_9BACT|nr:type II toxin-antitoxin system PemK/MazF family toxin [Sulfurospirillum tamanensis]
MVSYIPEQGDIVVLDFDPQSGHKQKGRRPAMIISNKTFNKHLGLAFACPITNTKRDFPFHVEVKSEKITGFVMGEQMKSIDYNARNIKFIEKANQTALNQILGIVDSILQ